MLVATANVGVVQVAHHDVAQIVRPLVIYHAQPSGGLVPLTRMVSGLAIEEELAQSLLASSLPVPRSQTQCLREMVERLWHHLGRWRIPLNELASQSKMEFKETIDDGVRPVIDVQRPDLLVLAESVEVRSGLIVRVCVREKAIEFLLPPNDHDAHADIAISGREHRDIGQLFDGSLIVTRFLQGDSLLVQTDKLALPRNVSQSLESSFVRRDLGQECLVARLRRVEIAPFQESTGLGE